MEKLDLLEKYVDNLLQQNAELRRENQSLREEKARLADDLVLSQLTADDFQEQLKSEQSARGTAENRLDGLISRVLTALSEDGSAEGAEAQEEGAAPADGQNEAAQAEPEAGMDEIL